MLTVLQYNISLARDQEKVVLALEKVQVSITCFSTFCHPCMQLALSFAHQRVPRALFPRSSKFQPRSLSFAKVMGHTASILSSRARNDKSAVTLLFVSPLARGGF